MHNYYVAYKPHLAVWSKHFECDCRHFWKTEDVKAQGRGFGKWHSPSSFFCLFVFFSLEAESNVRMLRVNYYRVISDTFYYKHISMFDCNPMCQLPPVTQTLLNFLLTSPAFRLEVLPIGRG